MSNRSSNRDYMDYLLQDENVVAKNVPYDRYLRRFDGRRTEWLMGYVVEHESITPRHNFILNTLNFLFSMFLSMKYPGAKVLLRGISMYIGDDRPAREPDLIILLPEHARRITDRNIEGTGDIVVEIVSPESKKRDREKKLKEYEAAGIPEYWLVDPLTAKAGVYVLDENGKYQLNPLTGKGQLQSKVLPGFTVDLAVLWRDDAPEGMELFHMVQQMIHTLDNPESGK